MRVDKIINKKAKEEINYYGKKRNNNFNTDYGTNNYISYKEELVNNNYEIKKEIII